MNVILQNVTAAVGAVGITVSGMIGIESRYLDEHEAQILYERRVLAEQRFAAQLAVNTSVAATLIDLRIRQYQYTADNTTSPAERDAMLERKKIAENELIKLGENYEKASRLFAQSGFVSRNN